MLSKPIYEIYAVTQAGTLIPTLKGALRQRRQHEDTLVSIGEITGL